MIGLLYGLRCEYEVSDWKRLQTLAAASPWKRSDRSRIALLLHEPETKAKSRFLVFSTLNKWLDVLSSMFCSFLMLVQLSPSFIISGGSAAVGALATSTYISYVSIIPHGKIPYSNWYFSIGLEAWVNKHHDRESC